MTQNDANWNTHRWSGWPGAFCQDCFIEDPVEIALADGKDFDDVYCSPCNKGTGETHE